MNDKQDMFEVIKNTIVGMLNIEPEYHHEMAEFCLQELDKLKGELSNERNIAVNKAFENGENLSKAEHKEALQAQREACAKKFRANAEVMRIHPKLILNLVQMILSATIEDR